MIDEFLVTRHPAKQGWRNQSPELMRHEVLAASVGEQGIRSVTPIVRVGLPRQTAFRVG